MKERFEQIYATNEWVKGSGEGSFPINNRGYIAFLEGFLREHAIESVVDLGCGDWQFSKDIDWGHSHYHGFDIVASVIVGNRKRYSSETVRFSAYSGDFNELPGGDLLIAKDVLQHWSDETIERFLPHLRRYRYALITNCVNPEGETVNVDIQDGDARYLDLRLPPFSIAATEVYSFRQHRGLLKTLLQRPQWLKRTLLIEAGSTRINPAAYN